MGSGLRKSLVYLQILAAVSGWYICNIVCGLTSKWGIFSLSEAHVEQSVFIFTCIQVIVSFFLAFLFVTLQGVVKGTNRACKVAFQWDIVQPEGALIIFLNFIGVWATNKAYDITNVTMVQFSKALEPISTTLLARLVLNEPKENFVTVTGMLITIVGITIPLQREYKVRLDSGLYLLFSATVYPLRNVLLKKRQSLSNVESTLSGMELLMNLLAYGSIICLIGATTGFCCMLAKSIVMKEGHEYMIMASKEYLRNTATLVTSSSLSFVGYQGLSLFVLSKTSALTHSMLNLMKRGISIAISASVEGKQLAPTIMSGILMYFVGSLLFLLGRLKSRGNESYY